MADASYIDTPESSSSIASTLQENLGNFEIFNLTDSKSDYFLNQRSFNKSNVIKRGLYSYRPLHDHQSCHLTNLMWFSVVCTLIDNDTRHHSGQNAVDSQGAAAAEWVHNKFWPQW